MSLENPVTTIGEAANIMDFLSRPGLYMPSQKVFLNKHVEIVLVSFVEAYKILKANERIQSKILPIKAWKWFNNAVTLAIPNSLHESYAYAHRAEFLIMNKKYEDCIKDCDRALQANRDSPLIAVACFVHKFKCYVQLGITLSAEQQENIINQIQSYSVLDEAVKTALANNYLRLTEEQFLVHGALPSLIRDRVMSSRELEFFNFERHGHFSCASTAIELGINKDCSRRIIAARDIIPGEVIVVEEKWRSSANFIQDDVDKFCFHCQKVSWTYIPCEKCCHYQYCSETCRTRDYESYHKWECGNFPSHFIKVYIVVWRFFFDLVRQLDGLDNFINYFKVADTILNLGLRHWDFDFTCNATWECRYIASDILFVCEFAQIFATKTDFLGKVYTETTLKELFKHDKVVYLAAGLLRTFYLYGLSANPYSVYYPSKPLNHIRCTAIYPFSRFFDHSCDPNAVYFTSKNHEMVVYAKYPIKKGSKITISRFNGTFMTLPDKLKRVVALRKANLSGCSCVICVNDVNPKDVKSLRQLVQDKKPELYRTISLKMNDLMRRYYKFGKLLESNESHLALELVPSAIEILKSIVNNCQVRCKDYDFIFGIINEIYIANFGNVVFKDSSLITYNTENRILSNDWLK